MTARKKELKDIIAEVDALDLPDGAYWAMINERLTGDGSAVLAQEMVMDDPEYFGWKERREEGGVPWTYLNKLEYR